MLRLTLRSLVASLLMSGCSLGPIQVTHKEGELPKIHVELPAEECKLRAKYPEKDLYIRCEWEY